MGDVIGKISDRGDEDGAREAQGNGAYGHGRILHRNRWIINENPGSVLLSVDSEAGAVVLDFTVEESEDLITWTPVEESGLSQTLTLPEGKRFYRFAH